MFVEKLLKKMFVGGIRQAMKNVLKNNVIGKIGNLENRTNHDQRASRIFSMFGRFCTILVRKEASENYRPHEKCCKLKNWKIEKYLKFLMKFLIHFSSWIPQFIMNCALWNSSWIPHPFFLMKLKVRKSWRRKIILEKENNSWKG